MRMMSDLDAIIAELREFTRERDWAKFHDPKNLVMLAMSEVGELAALFRWVDNREADTFSHEAQNRERVSAEVADVAIALLLLCDRLGIDVIQAIKTKIETNRNNYPVGESRGKADRQK